MKDLIADRPLDRGPPLLSRFALILSVATILTSLLHFWPLGNHSLWRLLLPANTLSALWILIIVLGALFLGRRELLFDSLPHVSVLAYLAINVMSISVADDPARAVSYTAKMVLIFVGSYSLFRTATLHQGQRTALYRTITAAAVISVVAGLVTGANEDSDSFGFFESAFKYASYLSVVVPLAATYLLLSQRAWAQLGGGLLVAGTVATGASMGLLLAVSVAMGALCCGRIGWIARTIVATALVGGFLVAAGTEARRARLGEDFSWVEPDGLNLRQRYLEWQAEINLLGERSIAGSGAGDINSQRSKYYHRLPKLNTLLAFDQNGWLTSAAENGLLGLICFCWIVLHHGSVALRKIKMSADPAAARCHWAHLAGLLSACVAHLFSSLYYNGVLIAFVLLLAMIGTEPTSQERSSHD